MVSVGRLASSNILLCSFFSSNVGSSIVRGGRLLEPRSYCKADEILPSMSWSLILHDIFDSFDPCSAGTI